MYKDFLEKFRIQDNNFVLCFGDITHGNNIKITNNLSPLIENIQNIDAFFTPAQFKVIANGNNKENLAGTKFLWVDIDDDKLPLSILPPTYIISSGYGWHLYFKLDKPIYDISLIEQLNKILIKQYKTADKACWNANRFLRIPGSINTKYAPHKPVKLFKNNNIIYTIDDITLLEKITSKTRHKILTGDKRGYMSRSERDFAVVLALLNYGFNEDIIKIIFEHHKVGDKVQDKNTHHTYLQRTINNARSNIITSRGTEDNIGIIERSDGYYFITKATTTRISTFIIQPLALVDGSNINKHDAILCNIICKNKTWHNVTLTKRAFTSVYQLDKEMLSAHWQFLGNEVHLRKLLPYILNIIKTNDIPTTTGVPYTGLYLHNDKYYFIGDREVLDISNYWTNHAPVSWLTTHGKNDVNINARLKIKDIDKNLLRDNIPHLNEDGVIWVLVGWFVMALLKPYLETINRRLPILSVAGTKGAGKSTIVQLLLKLFGQVNPKDYNANITNFSILKLLGSSYSLPIAFSEFRYEAVAKFLRWVLLSYDSGYDVRGTKDQSLNYYPLIRPFILHGEDFLHDPATLERIVVAKMNPHTIEEKTIAYTTYKNFVDKVPKFFAGTFIQYLIKLLEDDQIIRSIKTAETAITKLYPAAMPDRIRNNHVLILAGSYIFCDYINLERPKPTVINKSLRSIYNTKTNKTRLLIDDFIEVLVNSVMLGTEKFNYDILPDGSFAFQFSTAYNFWAIQQRLTGKQNFVLERETLTNQLLESNYFLKRDKFKNIFMYQIDLHKAYNAGLDIPIQLNKIRIAI